MQLTLLAMTPNEEAYDTNAIIPVLSVLHIGIIWRWISIRTPNRCIKRPSKLQRILVLCIIRFHTEEMRMTRHQTSDSSCNVASYSFVSTIRINIPEVLRSIRLQHIVAAPVLALNTIPICFTSAYNTSSLCTGTPSCPFFFTYMINRATMTILESFGCFAVLCSCWLQ